MDTAMSERELIARGKAGDHAAFTELIERSSPMVLRAIRAITPSPADAEDVMQETVLKAFKGLNHFNERCKFSTWLTRIAINNSLAILRRKKSRREISLTLRNGDADGQVVQVADLRADTEGTIIRDQTVAIIRRSIRSLPYHLRAYTSKRYLDELSHQEAASALGISVAAGKSRSYRARQALEDSLSKSFD